MKCCVSQLSSTKTRIVFYFEKLACLNSIIEDVLSLFLRCPWMPKKSGNEHKKKAAVIVLILCYIKRPYLNPPLLNISDLEVSQEDKQQQKKGKLLPSPRVTPWQLLHGEAGYAFSVCLQTDSFSFSFSLASLKLAVFFFFLRTTNSSRLAAMNVLGSQVKGPHRRSFSIFWRWPKLSKRREKQSLVRLDGFSRIQFAKIQLNIG